MLLEVLVFEVLNCSGKFQGQSTTLGKFDFSAERPFCGS